MNTMEQKKEQKNNPLDAALNRIKKEEIQPKSRWQIALQHWVLWVPGLISVIVGACAVAAIIFTFRNAGWEYRHVTHTTQFGFLLDILPSLWIILLVIFGLITIKTLRKTRRGYRYALWSIMVVSVVVSIGLGSGMYAFGVGEMLDRKVAEVAPPLHRSIEQRLDRVWDAPEEGRVSGVVQAPVLNDQFTLLGSGLDWVVDVSQARGPIDQLVVSDQKVRVIGYEDDQIFHACAVFPTKLGVKQIDRAQKIVRSAGDLPRIENLRNPKGPKGMRIEAGFENREKIRAQQRQISPQRIRKLHERLKDVGSVESCEDLFVRN